MRRAILLAAMLALLPGAANADDRVECEGFTALNVVYTPCAGDFTLDTAQNVRVEIRAHLGFTGCLYGFVDLPTGGTLISTGGKYLGGAIVSGLPAAEYRFGAGTYHFHMGTFYMGYCSTNSSAAENLGPVGGFSAVVTPV